ncbi:hypothetical protein ACFL6C_09185 [Myxococcota bacterium]
MDCTRILDALRRDATWLAAQILVFEKLYADDPATVALLNETAGNTFRVIEDSLFESIVLAIARLLDPAKTASQKNLTLQALIDCLRANGQQQLAKSLDSDLKTLKQAAASLRKHRNKRLAHTDCAIKEGASQLPALTMGIVRDAAAQVHKLLNRVESALSKSSTAFDYTTLTHGGPGSLIRRLAEAKAYRVEVDDWYLLGNPERDRIRALRQDLSEPAPDEQAEDRPEDD